MKLEQNQLEYLFNRSKNYDKKYYMFEKLLDKINDDINTIVELFGGVGLESFYLQNKFKNIKNHIIIEKDLNCYNILKNNLNKFPVIQTYNIDSFDFKYDNFIDLLVVDSSSFNKKIYDKIINLIKRFNYKYLIITDTGVFNVKLNKNLTYEQYWNNLKYKLANDNLYLTDVEYCNDFGLMLINTEQENSFNIHYVTKDDKSLLWRDIRNQILEGEYNGII